MREISDYAVQNAVSIVGANIIQAPDLVGYFPENKFLNSRVVEHGESEAIKLEPIGNWGELGRLMGEVIFLPNHIVQGLDVTKPEYQHLRNAYLIGIPQELGETVFIDDVGEYPLLQWNIHMRKEVGEKGEGQVTLVFEDELFAQKLATANGPHISYINVSWIWIKDIDGGE